MAETTADVRRDIEVTRERMTSTLVQLEQKMNLTQVVKEHPWPALAMAVGAGILLSGSRADVKAASATLAATQGTSSKIGPVLDDLVAQLMTGVTTAFQSRVESWVDEIKGAIGAPTGTQAQARQPLADTGYGAGPTSHAAGSTGPTSTQATHGMTTDSLTGLPRAD